MQEFSQLEIQAYLSFHFSARPKNPFKLSFPISNLSIVIEEKKTITLFHMILGQFFKLAKQVDEEYEAYICWVISTQYTLNS